MEGALLRDCRPGLLYLRVQDKTREGKQSNPMCYSIQSRVS